MKSKLLLKVAAPAAILAMSGSAMAGTIVGSAHDLTAGGASAAFGAGVGVDQGRVCVYCHTPHKAVVGSGPIWNKNASTATYTLYTSATMDGTTTPPGQESLACLTCHDGTVATDSMVNAPGLTAANAGATLIGPAAFGYVGTDLRDDHPIGMVPTADTAILALPATLPVYGGGEMECATCHDVHEPINGSFLRISNNASGLCTSCHAK